MTFTQSTSTNLLPPSPLWLLPAERSIGRTGFAPAGDRQLFTAYRHSGVFARELARKVQNVLTRSTVEYFHTTGFSDAHKKCRQQSEQLVDYLAIIQERDGTARQIDGVLVWFDAEMFIEGRQHIVGANRSLVR